MQTDLTTEELEFFKMVTSLTRNGRRWYDVSMCNIAMDEQRKRLFAESLLTIHALVAKGVVCMRMLDDVTMRIKLTDDGALLARFYGIRDYAASNAH